MNNYSTFDMEDQFTVYTRSRAAKERQASKHSKTRAGLEKRQGMTHAEIEAEKLALFEQAQEILRARGMDETGFGVGIQSLNRKKEQDHADA